MIAIIVFTILSIIASIILAIIIAIVIVYLSVFRIIVANIITTIVDIATPTIPCMVYLPTFTIKINPMKAIIPYMDVMGYCHRYLPKIDERMFEALSGQPVAGAA